MDDLKKHELITKFNEIMNSERCLFAEMYACEGDFIDAHTIARSHGLKDLAENGHVYSRNLKSSYKPIVRTFEKISINKVSTNRFACARHDNDLFKPIESGNFEINQSTVNLFLLRSLAQELYKTTNNVRGLKLLNITNQIPLALQKEAEMKFYFQEVIKGNSRIEYCHFAYDESLPFLNTSITNPVASLTTGEDFFDTFNLEKTMPIICINVFNNQGRGNVLFSWLEQFNSEAKKFIESILTSESKTDLLFGFLFVETENIAISSSFYESIPKEKLELLHNIMIENMNQLNPYTIYNPDVVFNLANPSTITKNY